MQFSIRFVIKELLTVLKYRGIRFYAIRFYAFKFNMQKNLVEQTSI